MKVNMKKLRLSLLTNLQTKGANTMLEKMFTTKMSMDKKKLQNRFSKIRSKNGKTSKFIALAVFAVIISCIEDSHVINVAEVPMYNQYREFALKIKNNTFNLFLPKIEINKNVREYISEELALILYNVLKTKLNEDFIRLELCRYIPDARNEELRTKQLFIKYFYQVILYKERKPGIYTEFDDHMRRVIVLEFYRRIIATYLDKSNR